jgi:hypothetical protein
VKDSRSVRVLVTASLALPIALLVLTPLVISPGVFAHFSLSKAVYARSLIELLAVAWAVQMLRSPELRPRHSWVVLALLAYLLASALAAVGGVNVSRSVWSTFDRMTGVFDLLHWSVLALVLSSVVRSQRSWHFLLNGQLVVTLLVALIAATQVWGISFIPSVIAKCRVDGTMGNASYLAPVLVMSILIAAGLLAQSFIKPGGNKWGYRRVLWISVVVLGSLVLVYTGTRGALIGLAAGAIAMPHA